MVDIELTKEQVELYNKGERVFIFDDVCVELYITKDKSKIYSRRSSENKKYGCYLLSDNDREILNICEKHLLYNGLTKVYIINKTGVDL
jgi:hypothetical protein